jgi:integral membrane protein
MKLLFIYIAKLEGLSLLALLFFAMPMKYILSEELYVRHIGMAHGILFIIYIGLAMYLKFKEKWSVKKILFVVLASIIPFGTFYIENKYLKS